MKLRKSATLMLAASVEAGAALRLRLDRWLAGAPGLELDADTLRTAVAPTWTEIGPSGAIVVLRTTLSFSLRPEIDKAEARRSQPSQAGTR